MKTARRGHRFAFIVLAVCSGLVVQTSGATASTIPCLGDCAADEHVTVDDPTVGWINGETFESRISRQSVAADNQRHVKYVPADRSASDQEHKGH
jgi:hypothetical protein